MHLFNSISERVRLAIREACDRHMSLHYALADLYFRQTEEYLRIPELRPGSTYLIAARNSYVGVFVRHGERYGFLIRRTKFDLVFLSVELHWDVVQPPGTAKPLALIQDSNLNIDGCGALYKSLTTGESRELDQTEILEYLGRIERRVGRCALYKLYRQRRETKPDSD